MQRTSTAANSLSRASVLLPFALFVVGACQLLSGLDDFEHGGSGGVGAGEHGGNGAGGAAAGGAGGSGCHACQNNADCDGADPVCLRDACDCAQCGAPYKTAPDACSTANCPDGECTSGAPNPDFCLLTCDGMPAGAGGDPPPCMPGPAPITLDATRVPANLECKGPICDGRHVICKGPYPCFISCQAPDSCNGLTVECGDGPCTLECELDACVVANPPTLTCGPNVCRTTCQAATAKIHVNQGPTCEFVNENDTCTLE
ncbi:MAG: hypothetical protein U0271_30020 [Polyangiaceae bacterium]